MCVCVCESVFAIQNKFVRLIIEALSCDTSNTKR